MDVRRGIRDLGRGITWIKTGNTLTRRRLQDNHPRTPFIIEELFFYECILSLARIGGDKVPNLARGSRKMSRMGLGVEIPWEQCSPGTWRLLTEPFWCETRPHLHI